MRQFALVLALSLLIVGAPLQATAQTLEPARTIPNPGDQICSIIESAARANALPVDFFARVIWQESRFQADAIGPLTRSGERAQGIAQFMPYTAAERRLLEPLNPVEALPKSGEFLAELRDEFGNLGLAAAAYNAGPQRVRNFIAGAGGLPLETRNYVLGITGRSVEDWLKSGKERSDEANKAEPPADRATSCHDIIARLKYTPNPLVAELSQRKVPSWCKHLHHPNVNVCGSVHQEELSIRTSSVTKPRGHMLGLRHHRA